MMPNLDLRRIAPGERLHAFRKCCQDEPKRVEISEWLLSATMAVVGIYMLLFPQAVRSSHMLTIAGDVPLYVIAAICFLIGVIRLALLSRRHAESWQFRARATLAIISAAIWFDMSFAFGLKFSGEAPPPGLLMMAIVQIIGDVWVALRINAHVKQLRRKGQLR